MPDWIDEELDATGVAQVIAVLSRGAAASAPSLDKLGSHFVATDASQQMALTVQEARRQQGELLFAGPGPARGRRGKRTPKAVVQPPAPMQYFANLGIAFGPVTRDGLAALRNEGAVEKVVAASPLSLIRPNRVKAARNPGTSKMTWGIETLGVPALWAKQITGKGILVAHLDTGVDGAHPAFASQSAHPAIKHFAVFDSLGRQINPPPAPPYDTAEHGTHTAATIAGRTVQITGTKTKAGGKAANGFSMGVAPGAELACGIVIEGGNVVARLLGGMDWAVGLGVRVLNMSLGLRGYREDFLAVTRRLREAGVLPVFAVGNEGPGTSRSPGNYPEALSVGAVDRQGQVADFSSSQRFVRPVDPLVPDLAGPGVDVISAKPGGGLQSMDGTSMATPHIAGLAALLFSARPQATVDEVETAIFQSCSLGPAMAAERVNRGLPNALRAWQILTGGTA